MNLPRAIALTAACAALLSACGGDDENDKAGDTATAEVVALTQAEYVEQGNAACAAYEKKAAAIEAEIDPEDLAPAYDQLGEEFSALLDQLEALEPPADVADQHDALMANGRTAVEQLGTLSEATTAEDTETIEATNAELEAGSKAGDTIANELGLTDCVGD